MSEPQPIDVFVEERAKLPSGKYELPIVPTLGRGDECLFDFLADKERIHGFKTASVFPNTKTEGSKAEAVQMWSLARKQWEDHLATFSPGEQLYFTTAFISAATAYSHGHSEHLVAAPSLLLECLVGDGSSPLAALKKWMADHPGAADGTVELQQNTGNEHRSALYALLDCLNKVMIWCLEEDGSPSGSWEVPAAAVLLMDAGLPLHAEADVVEESSGTMSGVVQLCRQLAEHATAFLGTGYRFGYPLESEHVDPMFVHLGEICRSFLAKVPAAER